jgi:hypothetical protein
MKVVVLARGIEASYRSSAYSPTALEKGATERFAALAPFSNGVLPKLGLLIWVEEWLKKTFYFMVSA